MKKYKYFALAFAALALGACSSDDVVDNGAVDGSVAGGETGYVNISINLPTQPSTRAANDNFAEGTADEYAVKNGVLLLFKGASESTATCESAYNLNVNAAGFAPDASDQIDSKGTFVQKITVPSTSAGDKIYALAVLNTNNLITVTGEQAYIGATSLSGKTLSDITTTAVEADASKLTNDGFFMSNAPLYSGTSTGTAAPSGSVTTLATVDPAKIYDNQTEASKQGNAAADIYVERAVAKVTVKNGLTTTESGVITGVEIEGWALNITNTKTYLVRNVAPTTSWWGYASTASTASNPYRFVGTNLVTTGLYRTYWGIDPNYNTYVGDDFVSKSGQTLEASAITPCDEALYCDENTFDLDNMNENQTTTVIVKAKLTVTGAEDGGSFYIIDGNNSFIYQKTGVEDYVKNLVQNWIEANKNTYFTEGTVKGTDLTVTLSNTGENDKGGYISVSKVEYDGSDITDWVEGQSAETLNAGIAAALNDIIGNTTIAYYKGGETYYHVKIKHFGDDLTPWTKPDPELVTGAYGDNEQDYLGRWGVLRNNWYEVTVKSITNIGSPSVPEVTNKSDDSVDSYISATINVLSWAKRTQDANL